MINCEDLKLSRTQEVWVQITDDIIPNVKPHYYVSNWGRIGSTSTDSFKLMIPNYDQDGYLIEVFQVYPYETETGYIRRKVTRRVNRLVLMAFYPIPYNYKELEVNHINSIRDDNHLWNLEWVTSQENTDHAINYGNFIPLRGSSSPSSKLTDEDIYKMVDLIKTGNYTYKELAEIFNVSPRVIRLIMHRQSWTHLDLDITQEDLEHCRKESFSNIELDSICRFFESVDINNELIYDSPVSIVKDCFYSLGLDKKYNFKSKQNTMIRILRKSYQFSGKLDNYDYDFIR